MRILLVSVIVCLLAVIGGNYAEEKAKWYARAAADFPQPDTPEITYPPGQQPRVTKLGGGGARVKRSEDGKRLVPATPEGERNQDIAELYCLAASICRTVKWAAIPCGLLLVAFLSFVRAQARRAVEEVATSGAVNAESVQSEVKEADGSAKGGA